MPKSNILSLKCSLKRPTKWLQKLKVKQSSTLIMDFSLLTSQSQFPACLFCETGSVWGVCGDFFTGQNDELTIWIFGFNVTTLSIWWAQLVQFGWYPEVEVVNVLTRNPNFLFIALFF